MSRLVIAVFVISAIGCESATEPTMSEVAATYEAVEFTTTADGDVVDQLAGGAALEITLAEDSTTTGTLFVPGGGEGGGDFEADLTGSWALEGDTVTFEHDADTFIRNMPFEYVDGRLVGEATFGGTQIRIVLALR